MQNHKTNSMLKLVVTAILSVMLLFSFVLPTSIFMANLAKYESVNLKADATNEITVSGLKKSYKLGDTVTIPSVTDATVVVKDPKNNVVTLDSNTFVANVAGDYAVVYSKGNTTTGEILISVKATTPSFNFATNSKYIIPSEIATGTSVSFPNPEILDENGDVIEGAKAKITIKKAGSSTPITTTVSEEIESYKFTSKGVYSVTYSYKATGMNQITKQYSIDVIDNFEQDVDLTYTLDGTMPTSMIQGVETELPKVIGKDKNNNNATVNVFTTITVEHLGEDGKYTPEVVSDFKFTPTKSGTYRVKYTVEDFYGNKVENYYKAIENVRDSKAPTIKIVEDYAVEEDGTLSEATITALKDAKDLSSNIPSVVAVNTEVTLPAIYAEDNVAGYSDLTIRRLIKSGSDQIANLDDTSVEAYKDNKTNASVKYTFDKVGTYTIIYKASDKSSNTTSDSLYSFTIVVKESVNDTIAPTITVKDFIKDDKGITIDEVEAGQKIRIVKPSIVDYADPSDPSNKDVVDTRPTLAVYAQVGAGEEQELALSEDGTYYEYTVPETPSASTINIRYVAKDCNGNVGNGADASGLTKTIEIINSNEADVPTITNEFIGSTGNQYESISINSGSKITVSDASDRNVQLDILVTLDGQKIDLDKFVTLRTKNASAGSTLTVQEATFTPNRAGIYVINYVAYDHSGNYSVKSTTITVASKATPVIAISDYETEMQLGNFYIPKANIYVDGKIDEGATLERYVEGDVNKIGTVKVTYKGKSSTGNTAEDVTITITIKDTVAPTVIVDGEVPLYASLEKDEADETKYKEIEVPGFTATDDGSKIDPSKYSITIKGKNGEELKKVEGSANGTSFRPTGDGKYTVIYSATDRAGNTKTESYTIAVGDVDKPALEIKEGSEPTTKATLKNGKYSLKISASDITITDNSETLSNDTYLTIVVKDSTGKTIQADEDTKYVYTLSEAGKYTVTITAKDKAANETVKTYTVDVSAEETKASTTTEVFGTVLLVLSILVLLGVVFYFVKPAPKSKKDKKKDVEINNEK